MSVPNLLSELQDDKREDVQLRQRRHAAGGPFGEMLHQDAIQQLQPFAPASVNASYSALHG